MDETRALLDQLMGRERDIPVDKRTNRARRVSDDDICKPYLCGALSWALVVVVIIRRRDRMTCFGNAGAGSSPGAMRLCPCFSAERTAGAEGA